MLEPRRLAAVAAARWMARGLGEKIGRTLGYSIRFDSRVTDQTRIEVVTEGILTRRLTADPALEGVALVIFDEFHERSLQADLNLAFCLDVQRNLREDLKILIMSATLDCGPLAALLGEAPVIRTEGRLFPVEERYVVRGSDRPLAERVAGAVTAALRETAGDLLVFLPGAGEIGGPPRRSRPWIGRAGKNRPFIPFTGTCLLRSRKKPSFLPRNVKWSWPPISPKPA